MVCAAAASVAAAGPGDGPAQNPPPEAAMKSFAKFYLRDLAGLRDAATSGNGRAEAKIAEHLRQQLAPIVKAWNAAGANSTETNTLQIEPQIRDIKFIGGKARFWAGALAGSSYVIMKIKLTEQPSGRLIAEPEFYQRAQAMSGAWTMGGQDNDMLQRVVTLATNYMSANYDAPVGGPTGR